VGGVQLQRALAAAGAKEVHIRRIVAAIVKRSYPSLVAWLDSVKCGYGGRFAAAFVTVGYEDVDDLKLARPTTKQLEMVLAAAVVGEGSGDAARSVPPPSTRTSLPGVYRISAALDTLVGCKGGGEGQQQLPRIPGSTAPPLTTVGAGVQPSATRSDQIAGAPIFDHAATNEEGAGGGSGGGGGGSGGVAGGQGTSLQPGLVRCSVCVCHISNMCVLEGCDWIACTLLSCSAQIPTCLRSNRQCLSQVFRVDTLHHFLTNHSCIAVVVVQASTSSSSTSATRLSTVRAPLLNGKHAFLSYQWDVQPAVVRVKELLNERQINCW
jgi:hypothetical protein